MVSELISASEPVNWSRATALFTVLTTSFGKTAIDAGAVLSLTKTPEPVLCRIAPAASCAESERGSKTVMGMLTRFRHLNKINPHAFRTNSYYELNVERCGHTIGLRGDRCEVGTKRDEASGSGEVYVSSARVGVDELGSYLVADVETVIALCEQSFNARLEGADEGSVIGHSGNDGIECFADAVLHGYSRESFRHFAFHLAGSIFLHCAV